MKPNLDILRELNNRPEIPSYYDILKSAPVIRKREQEEESIQQAYKTRKNTFPILWLSLDGTRLGGPYPNIQAACDASGVPYNNIKSALKKAHFTAGGYRFKRMGKKHASKNYSRISLNDEDVKEVFAGTKRFHVMQGKDKNPFRSAGNVIFILEAFRIKSGQIEFRSDSPDKDGKWLASTTLSKEKARIWGKVTKTGKGDLHDFGISAEIKKKWHSYRNNKHFDSNPPVYWAEFEIISLNGKPEEL